MLLLQSHRIEAIVGNWKVKFGPPDTNVDGLQFFNASFWILNTNHLGQDYPEDIQAVSVIYTYVSFRKSQLWNNWNLSKVLWVSNFLIQPSSGRHKEHQANPFGISRASLTLIQQTSVQSVSCYHSPSRSEHYREQGCIWAQRRKRWH